MCKTKISFLGAAREVGRSNVFIETDGTSGTGKASSENLKLMLDAGLKQWDHGQLPATAPKRPDAIIISHGHLDHCGSLPIEYKHEAIPAFCTFPTAPIIELLIDDSLKIARQEKKPSHYSKADATKALHNVVSLPYEKDYEFFEGTRFSLYDAGHILGSAQIRLDTKNNGKEFSLVYSGDFKGAPTRTHNGAKPINDAVDAVIIESTYAMREHPPREQVEKDLCESVQEVVDNGGIALLPCFAVGRTAEIIQILKARGVKGDIYLDGMGKKVCEIMQDYPSYVANYKTMMQAFKDTNQIDDKFTRTEAMDGPSIIIATAGMLEGGPALGFIEKICKDRGKSKKAKIFLTGFQVPGTNGDLLLREGKVRLKTQTIPVDLPVKQFQFSAHADHQELIDYVKNLSPENVFCIHGEPESCELLANEFKELGFKASAPELKDQIVI